MSTKPTVSGRAGKLWHDAHLLKLAFRCMQTSHPVRWREPLEACRTSKAERRRIIRDLCASYLFPAITHLHGVRT